jgi:plasmid stabilization system protein ParE
VRCAVILSPQASADLEAAALWIAKDFPQRALRWFDAISAHILKLSDFPLRCPLAPESRELSIEVRQTTFGKRRGCYRILFTVQDKTVHVLHVRHGMRASMAPEEIERLGW